MKAGRETSWIGRSFDALTRVGEHTRDRTERLSPDLVIEDLLVKDYRISVRLTE